MKTIFNSPLFEKEDSCNGSKTQSATTTESNTPENTVRMDSMDSANKTVIANRRIHAPVTFTSDGELITEKGIKESDIIATAITLTQDTNQDLILNTLGQLSLCIAHGNCQLVIKNFKAIMKMLLNLMESNINGVIIASLMTLSKILKSEHMRQSWSNFRELILLKIIDCYKTTKVSREIDSIIPKIAAVLPLDESINILKPVIATGGYPSNLCALNMLIALVDHQGKDLTESQLDSIMPNITRLTEDSESMVRKSAVFCIVKLYVAMGEDKVKPKLASLTASKLRLLHVYIKKAQSIAMDSANKTVIANRRIHAPVTFTSDGELITEKGIKESDIIATAITLTQDTNQDLILNTLGQLSLCIAHGNCQLVIKNFKAIMKMLLNLMESNINGVIIASLMTLSKILKSEHMRQSWSNFRELILLKIIDCYKTTKVSREIDSIIPKIAAVLPLDESINILKPVIATGGYPSNLCALNMLIALVDHQGKDLTESQLDSIMPNITRLTEDSESMVRKSAVFCIVKLYVAMGEDKVKPKLASLTASKLRLLHVYIKKAQSIANSSKSSSS